MSSNFPVVGFLTAFPVKPAAPTVPETTAVTSAAICTRSYPVQTAPQTLFATSPPMSCLSMVSLTPLILP